MIQEFILQLTIIQSIKHTVSSSGRAKKVYLYLGKFTNITIALRKCQNAQRSGWFFQCNSYNRRIEKWSFYLAR